MNRLTTYSHRDGLTVVELLAVIAAITIIIAFLLPAHTRERKAKVVACMSNLRQSSLGFLMFASDHHNQFPMQVPVAEGGTLDYVHSGHAFLHFKILESYGLQPRCLICPFDTKRHAAANFEALNDLALSYFVNCDVSTNKPDHAILSGDRFLRMNGRPVASGLLAVTTNEDFTWSYGFHANGGCLAFADGHVEFQRKYRLAPAIAAQPLATNRFSIP